MKCTTWANGSGADADNNTELLNYTKIGPDGRFRPNSAISVAAAADHCEHKPVC